MGRQEWINNMIFFQARCRGYVLRKQLRCVQAEYVDIVRELDGGVEHLSWRGHVIPKPHFTDADTDCALFTYPQSKIQIQACPEGVNEDKLQDETTCSHSEFLVPERDEEPSCGAERDCRESSSPPEDNKELEQVQKHIVAESAGQALQKINSIQQHATPVHTSLKELRQSPEALKQHRSTLAMELLWIQQAIASRKKYLTLKQKMGTA